MEKFFKLNLILCWGNLITFFFDPQSPITLCNLGVGATFGESVLHDLPRDSTVVTKTTCELLRVEQQDFRLIWEVSFFPNFPQPHSCIRHVPKFNNIRCKECKKSLSVILNYSSPQLNIGRGG